MTRMSESDPVVPSADMQALIDRLIVEDRGLPDPFELPLNEARAQFDRGAARWNVELPEVAVSRDIALSTQQAAVGSASLRIPPDARPGVILYLHGGGWMFGSPRTHERAIRCLARATGMAVIAPPYRLAPENPFPAGLDDCWDVWCVLEEICAQQGVVAGPCGISGDSAGANLALATMLRAQSTDIPPPDFAMLFYGAFGTDFATPSYAMPDPPYGLVAAGMRAYWDRYVPEPDARANPLVAPLNAPDAALAALPPLYLNAAELDPLRDDTLRLHERLARLGRDDACTLHRGVVHGFMQMTVALEEARTAFDLAGDWLATAGVSLNQGRSK